MSDRDPHRILGVARGATPEEIRAAFRRKVRQRHPDTASEPGEGSDVQEVLEAYHKLMDAASGGRHGSSRSQRPDLSTGGHRIRVRHAGAPAGADTLRSAVRCETCEGAGFELVDMACPDCGGRAEITTLSRTRARIISCRRCGGRGRIRARRRCETCSGSGAISV